MEQNLSEKLYDVIIIGSGPAALTAAIYTTRGAASTLVLAGGSWGGQLMLTTTVDNFPGFPEGIQGPDLMMKVRKQAERFGAEFILKDVDSIQTKDKFFLVQSDNDVYKGRSVVIATGADTKWLGVPGEDKLRGHGVSSCAPCDAPFFKDKSTAVVGGGDAAMEEALVLTKYSPQVTIIHRRSEFRASIAMQEKVKRNEKIRILWDSEVVEMLGEKALTALRIKTKAGSKQYEDLKNGSLTGIHRGRELEEKEEYLYWELPVDGVFLAIGHTPATSIFKDVVELDEKGYVLRSARIDKDKDSPYYSSATNIPGIFVAGDVHDYVYKQAITAAGFGCQAGMDVLKYLDKPVQQW